MRNTSNSYKTVAEILAEYNQSASVNHLLKDADNYLAHTPRLADQKPETLFQHLNLVQHYLEKLVVSNHLDDTINYLVDSYLNSVELNSEGIANFIKKLFVYSICYHDHGKVNENFQVEKMRNKRFSSKENQIGTEHSTLSGFIFFNHLIDEVFNFKGKEQYCGFTLCVLFSFGIYRHHSFALEDDYWSKIIQEVRKSDALKEYLTLFKKHLNPKTTAIVSHIETLKKKKAFDAYEISFPLYQLLRLNFSLLTASDYLATNEYMNRMPIDDFGVLQQSRINTIIKRVQEEDWVNESLEKRNFNKKTYQELTTLSFDKPKEKSNQNLNLLRQQMATEAILNLRKGIDKNIFYLEAPTGGGKTNISMLLTLELLKKHKNLNKVYYVFPFTTLIDQTYQSIKSSLDLSDQEIIALHSKSALNSNGEDDTYGENKKNYVNNLFVNYPFCMLSHIRFFDVLKTNIKEQNYILHRLANSVVVIDELQTYAPKHWDKVMYFIKNYAKYYNIRFIIMSATLPKIGSLEIEGIKNDEISYLLPNAKKDYFQNTNFLNRVAFDFSLINGKSKLPNIAEMVLSESINYAKIDGGETKPKGSVYTIIEFIFKQSATLFKQEIERTHNDFFDKIFVLSGTILHHRRKHIINFLKRTENREKRILLITTQVVEAGVDIDMDLGFKDTSLLDSDEQLAGRINRNVNKENCQLFLFNHNSESVIYGKDLRFDLTKKLTFDERKYILESKNFDSLYQKVIEFKNTRNQDNNFENLEDYISYVEQLKFRSVNDKFQLIEQENFSCFIPMEIPVQIESEIENEKEDIFTKNELDFLEKFNIFPTPENKVCGEQVFDLYLTIIHHQQSFLDKQIQLKQLQSILSKYVLSLFATEKIKQKLIPFMDVEKSEFGYFYMEDWRSFYDESSGVDESKFDNVENQFL